MSIGDEERPRTEDARDGMLKMATGEFSAALQEARQERLMDSFFQVQVGKMQDSGEYE